MPRPVLFELHLPKHWQKFRLPPALNGRLQDLLDRLDREGKLPTRERKEAEALVELVDMLTLMKARIAETGRGKGKKP